MIETKWNTFQGRPVSLVSIDQQHLSNVYWYMLIVLGTPSSELFQIQEQLDDRFNGQLMPYRPHPAFIHEIQTLNNKGLLHLREESSAGMTICDIIYNETVIGEIVTTPGMALRSTTVGGLSD
jgi:hypothetical protein